MAAKKRKDSDNTLMGWAEIIMKQSKGLDADLARLKFEEDMRDQNKVDAAELFHQLWGEAHDSPNYNKANWQKMQQLLDKLGIPA